MAAEQASWLTPDERAAWLALVGMAVKLPSALVSQLHADEGLSFFEYMILAVLSERPDRTVQMSEIAELSGVEVLEWFVIDRAVSCPRDRLGEPPRW